MLWGDKLCKAVEGIAGFRPFESQDGEVLFAFMEDTAVPVMGNVEYTFGYEDVRGFFGRTVKGFMLKLEPSGGDALYLWCTDGGMRCGYAATFQHVCTASPCGWAMD